LEKNEKNIVKTPSSYKIKTYSACAWFGGWLGGSSSYIEGTCSAVFDGARSAPLAVGEKRFYRDHYSIYLLGQGRSTARQQVRDGGGGLLGEHSAR